MRKFTLILSLLVAFVTTAMAQLEVGKVYQLKSGRDAKKVMFNKQDKPGTAAMSNSDYSQYFVIEEGTVEGTYAVRDLNYNKYLKPNKATSQIWTNSDAKTADTDLYISVENNETGAVSIRFSEPSVAGTHNGAHHEGWYGDIVSWEATADASRWTPVEIGTIDELNAKIEQEKATYNSAKSNAAAILTSANYNLVSTTKIALQVKDPNAAGYVWANTNAPGDEGVIDYLIDGDNNTFFHTNWNSYASDGTKDYLEVDLGEGNSVTNLVFDYVTRHNGSTDFPTSVTILGSNDKSEYEEVGTISFGLPVGNTKSYTSPAFGNGKSYRYIRFRVNSTSRGNASIPYFHLAEFNLYKAEVQITEGYEKYVSEVAVVDAANKLETTTPNEVAYAGFNLNNSVSAYNDANREVVLVYNLYYGERLIETQSVVGLRGEAFPEAILNPKWGYVKATTPDGVVETAGEQNITLTVEGCPFEFADSYNNITKWYYMNVRDDGPTYAYYDNTIDYIKATEKSVPADKKNIYAWAFIGNPFDGYQIVNNAAGESMVLSSPQAPTGTQNANELPRMVSKTEAAGNTSWIVIAPNHDDVKAENGFYIQHPTATSYAINRQGYNGANTLCYWTGRDTGSTFQVVECDMTGLADLKAYIAQVEAAIAAYGQGGTTVGYYTAESTAALVAALAEAKAAAETNTSAAENAATQVALQNVVAALETIQPEEGKFYYIASAMPSTDARGGQKMYVNNDGAMQFQNAETLGNVFQFVPAGDNAFYLYNVERGTYLNTAKGHNGGQATAVATTGSVKVSVANMGRENVVSIIPNGGAMLHAQASGSKVVAWNNTDNAGASAWIIDEVTDITELTHNVNIGEAGYSTLYLGCNVTIPEGVEAYTVTSLENGEANLAAVEGAIPAKTAVILKKAEEATTYSFNYAESAVAAGENMLLGSTINTYVDGPAYILAMPEGKEVGLYTAAINKNEAGAEGETHFKNNAFKAYMPKEVANESAYFGFRLPGTTGIENVTVENGVKAIFDLTGRRVESVTAPGIYIVNGKKVLVK